MKFNLMASIMAAGLLSGCATPRDPNGEAFKCFEEAHRIPQKKLDEAARFMREGIPFHVEVQPDGAICDGDSVRSSELAHLKNRFLTPLAESPYANKIKSVKIDASGREWQKWSCVIELEDVGSISLTHYTALYDGRDNHDPDGYKMSRQYVLEELGKIRKRIRWGKE